MPFVIYVILVIVFVPIIIEFTEALIANIIFNFNKYLTQQPFWTFENVTSFMTDFTVISTVISTVIVTCGSIILIKYKVNEIKKIRKENKNIRKE